MKHIFLKLVNILSTKKEIVFFGSKYGGWYFCDIKSLTNSFVISAGVGTDVSFDVELMQKYNAKIIFIDPTPKAIKHLNQVINSIGNTKNKDYSDDGRQSIDSYNLKNLNKKNFLIEDSALYKNTKDVVRFYKPRNNKHVSHSISNWQNNYSNSTPYIEVSTIDINSIIKNYEIKHLELLKLDIEGAEYSVLINMLKENILPTQILVEFDELQTEKFTKYIRYTFLIFKLLRSYILVHTANYPNFLFVRKTS
tara:strand:+ start:643 stop:1398 length:756 start_codon:yes stop_codon:yes gene_type:complete